MSRYRFSLQARITAYDCDPLLRARPAALLRHIQAAAAEHIDSLGLTYDRLYAEGFVFVVAGAALKIFRSPGAGEAITISTAPLMGSGAHMLRETAVYDQNGCQLAECQTSWALISPKTGKLLRASDFPHALPMLEGEWQPFFDPRKIRIHPGEDMLLERTVRLSDLDQNMHMNNTVYADVITDCFGEEYLASGGLDELLIRYHLQARLGDTLSLQCSKVGGRFAVGARCGEKRCFEGSFSLKALETPQAE